MLKNTFCSSPWFHIRLSYDGGYKKCRWQRGFAPENNINEVGLLDSLNTDEMSKFRQQMLNGEKPKGCDTCYYQDELHKLSARHKQLLKSGIRVDDFENSLLSSPHISDFTYSNDNNGATQNVPTDLHVDIGNLCNSGCIMCEPYASSKLVQDYIKLYKKSDLFYNPPPQTSWVENKTVFDKFLKDLSSIDGLRYIQLLGGETLYNKAFYDICESLIESGKSQTCILGTTTNGTIYKPELENIIPKFKEFHLGISIESVTPLNDYIRYPGKIDSILANIDSFLSLRQTNPGLHITLRITPNIFTVYDLDQLFEYAIEKKITLEACFIMFKPECLRMELMPDDIRQEVIDKLQHLIDRHGLSRHNITNIRNQESISEVTSDSVHEYLNFVKNYNKPADTEYQRQKLVEFLKSFESLRNNTILDYAPRYKEFLTSIGYKP